MAAYVMRLWSKLRWCRANFVVDRRTDRQANRNPFQTAVQGHQSHHRVILPKPSHWQSSRDKFLRTHCNFRPRSKLARPAILQHSSDDLPFLNHELFSELRNYHFQGLRRNIMYSDEIAVKTRISVMGDGCFTLSQTRRVSKLQSPHRGSDSRYQHTKHSC